MTWVVIAALTVGTLAVNIIGPLLAGGTEPPAAVDRVIELLTTPLASLIVTSVIGNGQHLVLDSRAAGVLVGAVLLLFHRPLLVTLIAEQALPQQSARLFDNREV